MSNGESSLPVKQNGKVVAMHLGWIGTKSPAAKSAINQSTEPKPIVRNLAVNLADCNSAKLAAMGQAVNLECKWDCDGNCCKKVLGRKVCEPVCKTSCESHNAGCQAIEEAQRALPPGAVEVPGGIQIPGIPGLIQRKTYDPNSEQVQRFAVCIHVPGVEAASCLSMLMGCAPAAAAAGVGYGVCVAATGGTAGAAHAWRCAQETAIAP